MGDGTHLPVHLALTTPHCAPSSARERRSQHLPCSWGRGAACTLSPHTQGSPRAPAAGTEQAPRGTWHLVQGVCPHVASSQGLVVGEDDRVILGVGLVAALSNPAAVVRERVMEAPVVDGVARHCLGDPRPLHGSPPCGSGIGGLLALRSPTEGSRAAPKSWGAQPPRLQPPTAVGRREWTPQAQGLRLGTCLGVSHRPRPGPRAEQALMIS